VRDIEGWLPDDLLVKVDRMTMRCSLEARVPFLDHEFVEFALSVPARHKLRMLHGPNKLLMRRSAAGLVPDAVAARPKRGFKPPLDSWFRGRLRAMAHDVLLASDAHLRARVDIGIVRRLLSGHDMGRQNGHRIWTLLVFELWSRAHGVG
jgi:asparagine synthase (glutamine-hydrolysing)